jgi:hypothetical protein
MPLPSWSDASPEERGAIRKRIHNRLLSNYRHTAEALVHACSMTPETVGCALDALVKATVVSVEREKNRTFYRAIKDSSGVAIVPRPD